MSTILLVDDEYQIVEVLAMGLEDCGFEVLRAGDGRAALELAQQHAPDLLVTDFMMPGMDGLELSRRLKLLPELAELPVILITGAHGHVAQESDGLFQRVVIKPFNLFALIDEINSLLA